MPDPHTFSENQDGETGARAHVEPGEAGGIRGSLGPAVEVSLPSPRTPSETSDEQTGASAHVEQGEAGGIRGSPGPAVEVSLPGPHVCIVGKLSDKRRLVQKAAAGELSPSPTRAKKQPAAKAQRAEAACAEVKSVEESHTEESAAAQPHSELRSLWQRPHWGSCGGSGH